MAMLKVNATQLWEQEVKKNAQDIMFTCKSDTILSTMLESMIVKIDSDIIDGRPFAERLEGIHNVLNSRTYYDNAHKMSPDAEVAKIKSFAEGLSMLFKVAQYEQKNAISDYSKQTVKDRLPNSDYSMNSIYGKANLKDRVD